MTNEEKAKLVGTLKARYEQLPKKNHEFAESLANQFETKGDLSDKQWFWVKKLVDQIETTGIPNFMSVGLLNDPIISRVHQECEAELMANTSKQTAYVKAYGKAKPVRMKFLAK